MSLPAKRSLDAACVALLLAGCASADKHQTTTKPSASAGMHMAGGAGSAVAAVNGVNRRRSSSTA